MNDSELKKHIAKLINLQKGDDGGELYYMESRAKKNNQSMRSMPIKVMMRG